jgi:hypothetical protein
MNVTPQQNDNTIPHVISVLCQQTFVGQSLAEYAQLDNTYASMF